MHALLHPSQKFFTAAGVALLLTVAPAQAQAQAQDREMAARLGKVEQEIVRLQRALPGGRPSAAENAAADAQAAQQDTDITVRLLALERTVAQLTGQIEETKFTAERTAKQVQVMQDDLSLRLARIEASLGASGVALPTLPQQSAAPAAPSPSQSAAVRNEPTGGSPPLPTIVPNAPLSQPVMTPPSAAPAVPPPAAAPVATAQAPTGPTLVPAPNAIPSDNGVANNGFVIRTDAQGRVLPADPNDVAAAQVAAAAVPAPPAVAPAPKPVPGPGPVTSNQLGAGAAPTNVSLPAGTPKEQYDFAFEFLKRQDYPKAEATLREFLAKNPKDPLAGNAQYWLGETYYARGLYREAVTEFDGIRTKYPKSAKAPDSMLKLGMSLAKLDQQQGACIALGLVGKSYPSAADVAKTAQAERAKLKCK